MLLYTGEKHVKTQIAFTLTVGFLLSLALLSIWSDKAPLGQALDLSIRYVSPTGIDSGACADPITPCATLQYAVDQAAPGDEVRVATGVYTDVHQRAGVTQTVYLSKTLTIRGGYTATFTDPPDPDANPTTLDAQEQGRVLYITGPVSATIEGLRITGGDAAGLGGGLTPFYGDSGGGMYTLAATVTLCSNRVFSNTAPFGGGLYLGDSLATLNDNAIADNIAGSGGGSFLNGSAAILSDNLISTNSSTSTCGGGLYLFFSTATLNRNSICANTTEQHGGGCWLWHSTATFSNNSVAANAANFSGGGLSLDRSLAVLEHNTFTANSAEDGGGLDTYSSYIVINTNVFTANIASHRGGGIYLCRTPATLDSNRIIANTAGQGGGLYLSLNSDATFNNNIIADNQAHDVAGGVYVQESSPYLRHTTIARNCGGDGSGVLVTNWSVNSHSDVRLINTILVSHTVGITVTAGNTATLEATLWGTGTWDNQVDWAGTGTIVTGERNIWGAPGFADPASGDYHIGPTSAAINAGLDAGVTTDVDGETRPDWCFPDVGADEFVTGMSCTHLYLPLVTRD